MDVQVGGLSLLLIALVLGLLGVAFLVVPHVPFLGRLPGDVSFQRGGFSLIFPLATSLILSVVLTLIINVAIRLFK